MATESGQSTPTVGRAQVLAYRVVAQGLDRHGTRPDGLAPTDIGWLDSPAGTAVQSLAARLSPRNGAPTVPDDWVLVWGLRGAPHLHRAADLPALARAAWPVDAADAAARLGGAAPQLKEAGLDALEALRVTTEAMAAVVTRPMVKGEASAAVTEAIPGACSVYCRRCDAVHVQDQLMRLAALPAGLRIEPGTSPPVLAPIAGWPGAPDGHLGGGGLVANYLRVNGPATARDVAAYLQTTGRSVDHDWPDDLVSVHVEGLGRRPRTAWLPGDQADTLRDAPPPRLVRLLPRSDPWLLARDRDLTVPDKVHRKALWPVLGSPGGLLVDGEIAGTWRARSKGSRLEVVVTPFGRLAARVRGAIDEEAGRVAATRDMPDVRVRYETDSRT
ncbi:MAG TPA: crosslink repair DNA glycosylase YcaQ family protein [Acidimicrobiales bacterium]